MDTDQMEYRCPTAELLGVSEMDGWQLLFKGARRAPTPRSRKPRSKVPVLVWQTPMDEMRLDTGKASRTSITRRQSRFNSAKPVKAMVYVMHENRPCGAQATSTTKSWRTLTSNSG